MIQKITLFFSIFPFGEYWYWQYSTMITKHTIIKNSKEMLIELCEDKIYVDVEYKND